MSCMKGNENSSCYWYLGILNKLIISFCPSKWLLKVIMLQDLVYQGNHDTSTLSQWY